MGSPLVKFYHGHLATTRKSWVNGVESEKCFLNVLGTEVEGGHLKRTGQAADFPWAFLKVNVQKGHQNPPPRQASERGTGGRRASRGFLGVKVLGPAVLAPLRSWTARRDYNSQKKARLCDAHSSASKELVQNCPSKSRLLFSARQLFNLIPWHKPWHSRVSTALPSPGGKAESARDTAILAAW